MTSESTWPMPPEGVGRLVTAMVTPFTSDGLLDLDGAAKLAEHLVATGSETLLVNGTTGESPTLQEHEPWRMFETVRATVGDQATVMIGTGANATAKTIESTRRAEALGADALLVVTPYYNRPDQRGLLHHFRAVASETSLPIVLYDIPGRTGRAIEHATLVELAQVPNIVGVKDAAGDAGKSGDTLAATRGVEGGFALWSGADELNLPLLALGGVGVISVSAHLIGQELAAMIAAFPTDPARARDLHLACMPLHRSLFAESSPGPLKGAMNAMGLPAGPVRSPLVDATPDTVAAVLAALAPIEAAR